MKKYILIANQQKDIEYQYADFSYEEDLKSLFFDYTKKRIGLLKIINFMRIRETNIIYRLIFQGIFNKTIAQHLKYIEGDEYVFIVMARVYEKYGSSLVKYLKKKYPSCKLVIYIVDLIQNMRFSLREAKKQFDIVCSFDKNEAEKNDIYFVLEPFSTRYLDRIHKPDKPQFDVSFVGAAKGRYDRIMWLFNHLTSKGLKCDFYIVGVEKKDQVKTKGIHYAWLDFEKVLVHAANSKCVAEIMQQGGYSATTRYAEALLLNKNLITDCPALQDAEENNIILFNKDSDLPTELICADNDIDNNKYIEMLSIRSFVNTIDKHLLNAGFK